MNRKSLFFAAFAAPIFYAQAQTTNNPGGVDPFILDGLEFAGDVGEDAATISGIDSFQSTSSSYQGGVESGCNGIFRYRD